MKFYCVTNIFELHSFHNEMMALLKLFEISTEMYFVSLFFLKERNITTSLVMIHFKCAVVHCANPNSNSGSINKPYLQAVEYTISFFLNSYLRLFLQGFYQKRYKKPIGFNTNFQNLFQYVVYILQNIRMSNLAILK